MENLRLLNSSIEKKLEKERKRLQKHTDLFKNYRQTYNRNLDESFSEDSTINKTQDSVFSDKESGQTDLENSSTGYSTHNKHDNYENNLTQSDVELVTAKTTFTK